MEPLDLQSELKEKLEEQIGECIGLERAAQQAVHELDAKGLLEADVKKKINSMKKQAGEHERKMEQATQRIVESQQLDEQSIEESAQDTVNKATQMMETYLGQDPDSQDALEFLCLAEGGEVTHYEVLNTLATKLKDKRFGSAVKSILKQEKQHLQMCTKLAKQAVSEA